MDPLVHGHCEIPDRGTFKDKRQQSTVYSIYHQCNYCTSKQVFQKDANE